MLQLSVIKAKKINIYKCKFLMINDTYTKKSMI